MTARTVMVQGTGSSVGKTNPFLAIAELRIEPGHIGSGVEFRLEAEVRSIPIYVSKAIEDFRKAIEDTVHDIFQQGLYGWQVTDCTVTMMDSDYSPPGSSASDFRYLSLLVLMNALKQVGTVVCEPISLLQH